MVHRPRRSPSVDPIPHFSFCRVASPSSARVAPRCPLQDPKTPSASASTPCWTTTPPPFAAAVDGVPHSRRWLALAPAPVLSTASRTPMRTSVHRDAQHRRISPPPQIPAAPTRRLPPPPISALASVVHSIPPRPGASPNVHPNARCPQPPIPKVAPPIPAVSV
ncbi:hypothetical protein C8R44DRAFT_874324 [Mycena epipterygia]|nr:hypothetical protein C8R44DRAFT_874324 [Mycena epipterygia]